MDIQLLNRYSLLENVKPIVKLTELPINTPVAILSAKIVKTRFGETVLLEFANAKTFLPKRMVPLMRDHIDNFADSKYSFIFEGLMQVGNPRLGSKFRFIEHNESKLVYIY